MAFFKKIRNTCENGLDIIDAGLEGVLIEIRKEQAKERLKDAQAYDKLIARAEKYCSKRGSNAQGIDAINECLERRNKLLDLFDQLF